MYNVVIGISDVKNNITRENLLNLEDAKELVVVDLDYLLDNAEHVLDICSLTRAKRDAEEKRQ